MKADKSIDPVETSVLRTRDGYIDIHSHVLPGIDDGPATLEESIVLCADLARQNVSHVIATPHQLNFDDHAQPALPNEKGTHANSVRLLVRQLNSELTRRGIDLTVHAGGEVRVSPDIIEALDTGLALTLCDEHRFVLIELPFDTTIPARGIVERLHSAGLGVILAHPERYTASQTNPGFLREWSHHQVMFQVNAGSIVGEYGRTVQKLALELIQSGGVHFIASDAHNATTLGRRGPQIRAAADLIRDTFGQHVVRQLLIDNPRLVVPLSEPPMPKAPFSLGLASNSQVLQSR